MADLDNKDERIQDVVRQLQSQLGSDAFTVVDHWDADRFAIGVAHSSDPSRLVYVSAAETAPDHYNVELESPSPSESDAPYETVGKHPGVDFTTLTSLIKRHLS